MIMENQIIDLYKYNFQIGRFKFPLGKLLVETIVFVINIIVIYYLIYYIIQITNI